MNFPNHLGNCVLLKHFCKPNGKGWPDPPQGQAPQGAQAVLAGRGMWPPWLCTRMTGIRGAPRCRMCWWLRANPGEVAGPQPGRALTPAPGVLGKAAPRGEWLVHRRHLRTHRPPPRGGPATCGGAGRARSAAAASAPAPGRLEVRAAGTHPLPRLPLPLPGGRAQDWAGGASGAGPPRPGGWKRCKPRSPRRNLTRCQMAAEVHSPSALVTAGVRTRAGHPHSGLPGDRGGCTGGAPRWPQGRTGRVQLPLPPGSPHPHPTQGAPPRRGSGTNPGKAALPGPLPTATPP